MDALHQQMNIAQVACAGDEFLLHLVEVIDIDVFGRFGRRGEQHAFRGALIIALQSRLKNGTTYGLAAKAAEVVFRATHRCVVAFRDRQAAMKATAVVLIHQ